MLDRLDRFAERLGLITVWVGGALLLFAACLVTVDVILRKLTGRTIGGADEIAAYIFAVSTAWAFSFVLLQRGNVRIDALYRLLPQPVRIALDIVSLVAMAIFVGALVWRAGDLVMTTIELGARSVTPMRTPLIVPQGLWFIGILTFFVVILLTLLRATIAALRGDAAAVSRIAGAAGVEDEAGDELRALEATKQLQAKEK